MTLKWFAKFINTLDFDDVLVDDPHSNVSAALLDRVKVYDAQPHIQKALDKLDDKNVLLCYPDEGAAKRIHRKLVESMCSASSTETGAPGKLNGWN